MWGKPDEKTKNSTEDLYCLSILKNAQKSPENCLTIFGKSATM